MGQDFFPLPLFSNFQRIPVSCDVCKPCTHQSCAGCQILWKIVYIEGMGFLSGYTISMSTQHSLAVRFPKCKFTTPLFRPCELRMFGKSSSSLWQRFIIDNVPHHHIRIFSLLCSCKLVELRLGIGICRRKGCEDALFLMKGEWGGVGVTPSSINLLTLNGRSPFLHPVLGRGKHPEKLEDWYFQDFGIFNFVSVHWND